MSHLWHTVLDIVTTSGVLGPSPILKEIVKKFQSNPHWRDHILFYEYFHGDNGAGLGASHQTGWTGLVAKLIQLYGLLDSKRALEGGKQAAFVKGDPGADQAIKPGKLAASVETKLPAKSGQTTGEAPSRKR